MSVYTWPNKQKRKRKKNKQKPNTPISFNTNYRREMKLIPNYMDYYLLEFDALNFFLWVQQHRGTLPNFNFSNANPEN